MGGYPIETYILWKYPELQISSTHNTDQNNHASILSCMVLLFIINKT